MREYLSDIFRRGKLFAQSTPKRLPIKTKRWLQHFNFTNTTNINNYAPRNTTILKRGSVTITFWLLRLFTKTADLLHVPELVDVAGQILKPNTRALYPHEIREAKRIFGDALPYQQIRIDENALLARLGASFAGAAHMGVCLFYTIHFTRPITAKPGNKDMAWLIHELVHIAQMHYVGSQYTLEALYAQFTDGYNYGGAAGLQQQQLPAFNREQQGSIIEHYYYYSLHDRLHPVWGLMPVTTYLPFVQDLRKGIL